MLKKLRALCAFIYVKKFKKYFSALLHLIWPEHCPVCGMVGVSHCPECLESVVCPLKPFCLDCGGPYGVDCCYDSVPCYAGSLHEGHARDFILNLKYRNAQSLGLPMGRLLGNTFRNIKADIIVPVPLHKASRRGYNQSDMLALGIAEEWCVPAECGLLKWNIEIGSQMGKGFRARAAIPPNAVYSLDSFTGRKVILVDDVYTTGGTLRAAKSAVENAGGIVVGAIVWSRRVSSLESEAAWRNINKI